MIGFLGIFAQMEREITAERGRFWPGPMWTRGYRLRLSVSFLRQQPEDVLGVHGADDTGAKKAISAGCIEPDQDAGGTGFGVTDSVGPEDLERTFPTGLRCVRCWRR